LNRTNGRQHRLSRARPAAPIFFRSKPCGDASGTEAHQLDAYSNHSHGAGSMGIRGFIAKIRGFGLPAPSDGHQMSCSWKKFRLNDIIRSLNGIIR
jgi:hypothetical protein